MVQQYFSISVYTTACHHQRFCSYLSPDVIASAHFTPAPPPFPSLLLCSLYLCVCICLVLFVPLFIYFAVGSPLCQAYESVLSFQPCRHTCPPSELSQPQLVSFLLPFLSHVLCPKSWSPGLSLAQFLLLRRMSLSPSAFSSIS